MVVRVILFISGQFDNVVQSLKNTFLGFFTSFFKRLFWCKMWVTIVLRPFSGQYLQFSTFGWKMMIERKAFTSSLLHFWNWKGFPFSLSLFTREFKHEDRDLHQYFPILIGQSHFPKSQNWQQYWNCKSPDVMMIFLNLDHRFQKCFPSKWTPSRHLLHLNSVLHFTA